MFNARRCYERPADKFESNVYPEAVAGGYEQKYNEGMMKSSAMTGCEMPPIYECPEERICHKEFIHEVPHICPINTRVINHHIYRHTFTPCYTCCEENEICNIYDGCCNKF